jgi:tRNA-dihydrouridine synthase
MMLLTKGTSTLRSASAFFVMDKRRQSSSLLEAAHTHHAETPSGLILPSHPNIPIKTVMAPMVAASDYPFRHFLRKHCGVDLTYTQMLHSKNFCTDSKFRRCHLDLYEAGATYGEFVPSQLEFLGEGIPLSDIQHERAPLMVQLAGHDPQMVVKAALMIMDHTGGQVSGFDLNCGCPQGIARRGRYGAFLMEEDDRLICSILSTLREALPSSVAVSAKIRLPLDDDTLQDRIPRLVGTGINFLTIHGRTLLENKTKVGPMHTNRVRLAIEAARRVVKDFPVVANGGMETYRDVQEILEATGAVAAMSSEALLETPNIFLPESLNLDPKERMEQQFPLHETISTSVHPSLRPSQAFSERRGTRVARSLLRKGTFSSFCTAICKSTLTLEIDWQMIQVLAPSNGPSRWSKNCTNDMPP